MKSARRFSFHFYYYNILYTHKFLYFYGHALGISKLRLSLGEKSYIRNTQDQASVSGPKFDILYLRIIFSEILRLQMHEHEIFLGCYMFINYRDFRVKM